MATATQIHVIYIPDGMSVEQVWEHITREREVAVDPRETDDPDVPTKYGRWVNVLVQDGVYRGEV